jgi:hypothetical protein
MGKFWGTKEGAWIERFPGSMQDSFQSAAETIRADNLNKDE